MTTTNNDPLLEQSTGDMLSTIVDNQAIALWSDDKRTEFIQTFENRVRSARYILEYTGYCILGSAFRRKLISQFHLGKFPKIFEYGNEYGFAEKDYHINHLLDTAKNGSIVWSAGARPIEDLEKIARERARLVIEELPQLKNAIKIIDPETASKIDRRDALIKEGQKLAERYDEISEAVSLEELDQTWTIKQLRDYVKKIDRERRKLIERMNEIGREGKTLDDAINKRLYRGIPGLSDAIVAAAEAHFARSQAFDQMLRRVTEQIKFGDSQAAMELLSTFEKDEATLPNSIKESLKTALDQLKLGAKKQLKDKAGNETKESKGAK